MHFIVQSLYETGVSMNKASNPYTKHAIVFSKTGGDQDTDPKTKMKSQRLNCENDLENNLYPLKIGMNLC